MNTEEYNNKPKSEQEKTEEEEAIMLLIIIVVVALAVIIGLLCYFKAWIILPIIGLFILFPQAMCQITGGFLKSLFRK